MTTSRQRTTLGPIGSSKLRHCCLRNSRLFLVGTAAAAIATLQYAPAATAFQSFGTTFQPRTASPLRFPFLVKSNSNDDGAEDNAKTRDEDSIMLEELQGTLHYIEALEERNKSQLGSFIDEQDQWESMEDFERELLSSKDKIQKQFDDLLSRQSNDGI